MDTTTLINNIRRSLNNNPAAVVKALEVLYDRQTADEQFEAVTIHHNRVGFSCCDANLATWLVTKVIADGRANGRPESCLLRGKALEMGRRIALRYSRTQLLELAVAKAHSYTPPTPEELGCFIRTRDDIAVEEWEMDDRDDYRDACYCAA